MSPSNRSRNFTVTARLIALVALLAAAIVATAFVRGDSAAATDPQAEAVASDPAAPTLEEIAERKLVWRENFALLRRPVDDEVPSTWSSGNPSIEVSQTRLAQPPAARLLATEEAQPPDATVWVTPRADGGQCLMAQMPGAGGPSYGCSIPDLAVIGYFVLTQSPSDDHAEVYGLMPDGVDSVDVTLYDGTVSTLPVTESVYMAKYTQPIVSIAWIDPSGQPQSLDTPTKQD